MPDIFDQIATGTAVAEPKGDIFDRVAEASALQPAPQLGGLGPDENMLYDEPTGVFFHKQASGKWSSVRTQTMTTTEGAINFPTVMPGGNILEGGEAVHFWQSVDPSKIEQFMSLEGALEAAESKHLEHEGVLNRLLADRGQAAVLEKREAQRKARQGVTVADTMSESELDFSEEDLADPLSQLNDETIALRYGITPEEAGRFRKMPPIGAGEKFGKATATDVGERLPLYGPLFSMKRARNLRMWAEELKSWHEMLAGDEERINEMEKTRKAIWPEAVQSGLSPTLGEAMGFHLDRYKRTLAKMKNTDAAKGMADHLRLVAEYEIRGETILASIGTGISVLPKYMVEFMLTGGIYSAGKGLVMKVLEHKVKSTVAKLALQALAAAGGTTLRTIALGGNVIGGADARIVPTVRRGLDGRFYIEDSDKKIGRELWRSLAHQWIENYTEVSGVAFGKAMKAASPKMYAFLSKLKDGKFGKTLKAGGFHGVAEEMGEEALGRFLRWGVGLTSFDLGQDVPYHRTWRELIVEMGVIGAPALLGLAGKGIERLGRGPRDKAAVEDPSPSSVVDDLIAADEQEAQERPREPEPSDMEEIDLGPPPDAEAVEAPESLDLEEPPVAPSGAVEDGEAPVAPQADPLDAEIAKVEEMTADELMDEAEERGVFDESMNYTNLVRAVAESRVYGAEAGEEIAEKPEIVQEEAETVQPAAKPVVSEKEIAAEAEIKRLADEVSKGVRSRGSIERTHDKATRIAVSNELRQREDQTRPSPDELKQKQAASKKRIAAHLEKNVATDSTLIAKQPTGEPYLNSYGEEWIEFTPQQRQEIIKESIEQDADERLQEQEAQEQAETQQRDDEAMAKAKNREFGRVRAQATGAGWTVTNINEGYSGFGTKYLTITHDETGVALEIRVSDHPQPAGRGGKKTQPDKFEIDPFHDASDVDFVLESPADTIDLSILDAALEKAAGITEETPAPAAEEAPAEKAEVPETLAEELAEQPDSPEAIRREQILAMSFQEASAAAKDRGLLTNVASASLKQIQDSLIADEGYEPDARKGIFKQSTVDAAKKRISDKLSGPGANLFLDPALIRDMGIVIIDYAARGVRKLGQIIANIQTERDIDPGSKQGQFIARAVRKAWNNPEVKKAVARVQEIEKAAGKAQTAAGRRVVVRARIMAEQKFHQGETIKITAQELLDTVLKYESKGARVGYLAGAKDVVAKHKDLAKWAENKTKGLPLSEADHGKLMYAVARANTMSERLHAIEAIEAIAARGTRNRIINGLDEVRTIFAKRRNQADFEIAIELGNLFTVFKKTARAGKVANAISRVLTKLESLGRPVSADSPVWKTVAFLNREPNVAINRMETSLLLDTVNAISDLVHQEAHRNDLLAKGRYEDAAAKIKAIIKRVEKLHPDKRKGDARRTGLGQLLHRALVSELADNSELVEVIGGQTGLMEILHDNLRDADTAEFAFHQQKAQFIKDHMAAAGIDTSKLNATKWAREKVTIKIGGQTVTIDQGELATLIGNLRTAHNREVILSEDYPGIEFSNDPTERYKLSEAEIPAISAQVTKTTDAIVNAMKAWWNGPQRDMSNEASQHLEGRDMSVRDYFPMRTDHRFFDQEPDKLIREWKTRYAENAAQMKHRVKTHKVPIIISDILQTFERHTKVAGVYITKQAATHDALKVLEDTDFQNLVQRNVFDGKNLLKTLRENVIANHGLNGRDFDFWQRSYMKFWKGFQISALALKPHIVIYQPLSYLVAATRIPLKYWAHRPYFMTNARRAEITKWSPDFAARLEAPINSIMSSGEQAASTALSGRKPGFWGAWESIRDITMAGIRWGDSLAIANIWEAKKKQGRAKGLTGAALMRYTSVESVKVVDDTQPTWGVLTSSKLALRGRENPYIKPLTMFSSQIAKSASVARKAMLRYSRGEIGPLEMVRHTTTALIASAVAVYITRELTMWAYSGFQPDGDDEKDLTDRAWKHAFGIADKVSGQWLIGREVIGPVLGVADSVVRDKPYYHRGGPVSEWIKTGTYAAKHVAEAIKTGTTGERFKSGPHKGEPKAGIEWYRAIWKTMEFGATPLGVPVQGPAMIYRRFTKEPKKAPEQKRISLQRGPGARRKTARPRK